MPARYWCQTGQGDLNGGCVISPLANLAMPTNAGVAGGASHGCVVDPLSSTAAYGQGYCFGNDEMGQLGNQELWNPPPTSSPYSEYPVVIDTVPFTPGLPGITSIAAGGEHTCAVSNGPVSNEMVYCWGENDKGQTGQYASSLYPTIVPFQLSAPYMQLVKQVAVGEKHSCAVGGLGGGGKLWCWGGNGSGQLGNGTTSDDNVPQLINVLGTPVVQVACGKSHTCALLMDGNVACWGLNAYGQLGTGGSLPGISTSSPQKVLNLWPSGSSVGAALGIAAGDYHTCAVVAAAVNGTAQNQIVCWGMNAKGQLGTPSGDTSNRASPTAITYWSSPVIFNAIAAGGDHSCALAASPGETPPYRLACWGDNTWGALGSAASSSPGFAYPVGPSGIAALACGGGSTYAMTAGGTVYDWGLNNHFQLGYNCGYYCSSNGINSFLPW
jgi:alpha-tubulin suppressor-like RCC1 family protein